MALIVVIVVLAHENNNIPSVPPEQFTLREIAVQETQETLLNNYVNTNGDTSFGESAHLRALYWLGNHTGLESLPSWRRSQLYAIMTFFYSLNGPNWDAFDRDWFGSYDENECYWGDQYDRQDPSMSACRHASNSQKITQLQIIGSQEDLRTNQLINAMIGIQLPDKEIRWIYNVVGGVPREVAFLTSLEAIHIQYTTLEADLTDMIPRELAELQNLTTLNYADNLLFGAMPTHITRLRGLKYLSLKGNNLTGTILSELGSFPRLKELQLQSNDFTGTIPPELSNLHSTLEGLSLRDNHFSGVIPPQFGQLTKLTSLMLAENKLSGTIPVEITSRLPKLKWLSLWSNNLEGTIPTEIAYLGSGKLQYLELQDTNLTGSLPTELGLLTELKRLHVYGTRISGTIPKEVCSLSGLGDGGCLVDCLQVVRPVNCDACKCYGFT